VIHAARKFSNFQEKQEMCFAFRALYMDIMSRPIRSILSYHHFPRIWMQMSHQARTHAPAGTSPAQSSTRLQSRIPLFSLLTPLFLCKPQLASPLRKRQKKNPEKPGRSTPEQPSRQAPDPRRRPGSTHTRHDVARPFSTGKAGAPAPAPPAA